MEAQNGLVHPRKRRRRRRLDRPAISARLLLDDRINGEVGVLSEDLFNDLFPGYKKTAGVNGDAQESDRVHHVAITPWLPSSIVASQTAQWTILPVRVAEKTESSSVRPHSSLQIPASSLALQSFSQVLRNVAPNKTQRRDTPIEVRIYDVVPVGLDTVYVNLDTEALRKLDEVHAKFGGGFIAQSNGAARGPKNRYPEVNGATGRASRVDHTAQEETWRKAVREALQSPTVLHNGDLLPLPLPAHPITHVPPPPAKISACEPVSQGLLLPSTRIVVLQSHRSSKTAVVLPPVKPTPTTNGFGDDDEADDTSNDTFYSAAEERGDSRNATPPDEESTDNLESDLSDAGDLSDDSEDIISLAAPMLPPQSSGVLSSFTSATPRPGNYRTNGIATPGSVYSSFTATTARGPSNKSKVFKAQGLLQSIPDDLVHPKPGGEDDEEARVFVDTNTLVKVGCFSGDWVKVEATEEPSSHPLWGLGAFGGADEEDDFNWRPVRVFGLPENMSKKIARYPVHKSSGFDRRNSISGFSPASTSLQAYLSPILLANLGSPSHLRITPLAPHQSSHLPRSALQKPRLTSSSLPPSAKEVTLLKVSTPLSSDRLLQPSLFAALKEHFEQKRRIVKSGDLIGVSIDESLGRAVFQPTTEEDIGNDELLARTKKGANDESTSANSRSPKVVSWFKIGNVSSSSHAPREGEDGDVWGGAVTVDAASTKMEMNGSEQGKTPAPINNAWQYYLGAKRTPVLNSQKTMVLDELPKPYISSLRRRLRELMSVATSPRAIHLGLPPIAVLITSTQRGIGKSTVATKACEDLGLHTFYIDAFDIITEGGAGGGDVKTEGFLKARAERALTCGAQFTALLIKHVDALNADRMNTALKEILADSRVLIATTTEIDKVPEGIRGLFTHEIEMMAPDEGEREGILRSIIEDAGIRLSPEADLGNVAVKTAALVAGDLVDVVDRALVAKSNRLEALAASASKASESSETVTTRDIELAGGHFSNSLTKTDLDGAVDAARKNFADAIGAPKIPNVGWSDVGGLTHVKDAVMETIQLPLSRPELFAKGMKKRSGILFYGPPGTGKTLLAKAIATEFSLNFFSVKGPELLNMYIGESEANVRRVFQRARDARPCVVFFDELDSVAPKRGNQGDSGGVMDRIVSQLLAELDGMSDGGEGVFVIGATNRPDLLDQALLRPGRFDKMLYLGVSDTHEKQQTILEALTRKFTLHPDLSLQRVSQGLPFTYTGADMYALCSDAMLKAITRQARAVDEKVKAYNKTHTPTITIAYYFDHLATEEDTAVMVTEEDFVEAHRELVPSVSADELRHYEGVRKAFEGTGKKEDEKKKQTLSIENSGPVQDLKGKGKAKAPVEDEADMVVHTQNLNLNGPASSSSGSSGKGKGKAPVANHGGKSSVDIAEGGFGDATQDDDLYS
ncbi:AAA-domain-containing protein [Cucurbitaria berberidis CBS 394.84]|uniref:Peroxisomal ATPase PEX6 n=1 Tax=Cucurbitaria berberidis CBS 394.84 TaxID=1168544 RepID=A0A9P4G6W8_9PLEO|nr:AAA-domain-containing protein [Cucurbitaria berberidis CBS 394.84]KAF1840041.1 AAA-domain-containing protein [Cucurbitaria berberidis CBS 394.84]